MIRVFALAAIWLWLGIGAAAAQAQLLPGTAAEPAEAPAATSSQTLIELLRDDAAREELIRQLEQVQAAEAAAPAEPEPDLARSLGSKFAEITQGGAQSVAETMARLWTQLTNLPVIVQGLAGAMDPDVLMDALGDLVFVIIATYLAYILLRLLSRRIARRLANAAEGGSSWRRIALSLASSLVDVGVVLLAWAAGYLITVAFSQGFGVIQMRQSLYLNAFLSVELAKVAARAVLAPAFPALRLVTLSDEAVRIFWRWLSRVISWLGYGLLLVVPIVNSAAGFFAGSALASAISAIAILATIVRVVQFREPVAGWLHPRASDEDPAGRPLLARLAGLWHWPVLVYLVALLVLVLARPGNVLLPVLQGSGVILGALVVGRVVSDMLGRFRDTGIRVPGSVSQRMPYIERRLNTFVPQIAVALRAGTAIVVIAVALNVLGIWELGQWINSASGSAFSATLISTLLILVVAFLIWLGFSSWVDYRLNPLYGTPPSPREITLLTLLRNAVTIALMIFTLMFVLSELGLDIAPLIASAGVLGLAIGFGSQKLVQDIITGVFIQFDNAINVGDVVTLGGITGTVEKLTVRSVSLRDVQGVFHIIPFSSVDLVSNYMRDFSYFLCDMGVAYREDIETVKTAMHDAFEALRADEERAPFILGDLEWLGLQTFGDSAIILRCRIKTTPGKQWDIGRAYNGHLKEIFDASGIEIPFPHQTIYFGEDREGRAPPLHIRTEPAGEQS